MSAIPDDLPPANPALRVAAAALRADPDSVLAAVAVLDALRFSSVLAPASTGDETEVRFIDDAETGDRILPIFSDAERQQAWPLSDGLGALVLDFAPLRELVIALEATTLFLDPDSEASVTIDAAALIAYDAPPTA